MDNLTTIVREEIARQYRSVRQFAFAVGVPLSTTNTMSDICARVESLRLVKVTILWPFCRALRTSFSTGLVSPLWLTANITGGAS